MSEYAEKVLDAAAVYVTQQYGASYGLDHPVDRERILSALAAAPAPSSLAGGARERIKTILDEETTVGGTSASRSGAVNSDELAGLILAALAPEAPAEGAGERTKGAAELQAELDQLANDYGDLLTEVEALRARSSAPEAREGEPVGVVYSLKADLNTAELPDGTLLYTHPAHPSADKLRFAVEALEKVACGDGGIGTYRAIAQQALAALKGDAKP